MINPINIPLKTFCLKQFVYSYINLLLFSTFVEVVEINYHAPTVRFFFVASLEFISMPAPARRAATEQSIISCKRPGSATDGLTAMAHSQNHEGMTTTTTLYTVLIFKALTRS